MKIFVFLLGMTLSGAGFCNAATVSSFEEANAKYQSASYGEAAALYQKALKENGKTAAVYYNLGSAAFRSGDKGRAVLSYERAFRLDPRDADIRWNRGIIKSTVADAFEETDGNIFISSLRGLLEWVTMDETCLVFGGSLSILFLISLINLRARSSRAWTSGIASLLLLVWVFSGVTLGMQWHFNKQPQAVILAKEVVAFYGPSEKETRAFTLREGAQVRILDQTKEWYLMSFGAKNSGWIKKSTCELI